MYVLYVGNFRYQRIADAHFHVHYCFFGVQESFKKLYFFWLGSMLNEMLHQFISY